jgi:hypothetical protein
MTRPNRPSRGYARVCDSCEAVFLAAAVPTSLDVRRLYKNGHWRPADSHPLPPQQHGACSRPPDHAITSAMPPRRSAEPTQGRDIPKRLTHIQDGVRNSSARSLGHGADLTDYLSGLELGAPLAWFSSEQVGRSDGSNWWPADHLFRYERIAACDCRPSTIVHPLRRRGLRHWSRSHARPRSWFRKPILSPL